MEKRNPNRISKVNALIQKLLGEILRPYLEEQEAMVTISKIESSRDLRWAKVWLSILGGDQPLIKNNLKAGPPHPPSSLQAKGRAPYPLHASGRGKKGFSAFDEKILSSIQKNLYAIQGELNRKLKMKIVPRLQFFLDTSPRYVQHIDELINKMHDEGIQ